MQEKAGLLSAYFGLLLVVCVLPFALLHRKAGPARPERWAWPGFGVVLVVGAAVLLAARGVPGLTAPLVLSLAFVVPLAWQGRATVLGGLTALPLLAAVTWWAPDMQLGVVRAVAFVLAGTLAAALPRLKVRGSAVVAALLTLSLLSLAAVLFTGSTAGPIGFWAQWHHWSVYVAPAESMLAGAIPFRDFPVQYGVGPMLLVAGLCRGECWTGTYWAVAASNLLYVAAMTGCVGALTRPAPRGLAVLALAAMGCAILLWTGYPPDYVGPTVIPSVLGLRFLPLAALLFCIVATEYGGLRLNAAGHALWLLGVAWSPEAAFFATAVWWPYVGLRHAQTVGASRTLAIAVAAGRGAAIGFAALAIGIGVLTLVFRLGFGVWPLLQGFTTYIRNPPGILPVNPQGPIWLVLGGVAVGALSLLRADARGLRTGFACVTGLLAAGSYFLGRSHDNNILNLLPFVVLAMTMALRIGLPAMPAGFARMVLAGMVAWPMTFGVQSWRTAWQAGEAASIGPARFIERIRLTTPDAWTLLDAALAGTPHAPSADAGAALRWLREAHQPAPLWVSAGRLLPYDVPGAAWTGMSDLGLFGLLPHAVVEHFIRHGAQALGRSGWILVDRADPEPWLALFAKAYDVTEERVFGGYTAYRLEPR